MGTYEPCVLGSDGNCTRWSHDHAADRETHDGATTETTTATIEDAVGELLERMSNAVTRLEALRDEHWYPPERQRLHGKVEGVKLATSYVEEARDLLATARTATTEDAEEVLHGAGWFARADLDPRDLRGILHDLADAGLLRGGDE